MTSGKTLPLEAFICNSHSSSVALSAQVQNALLPFPRAMAEPWSWLGLWPWHVQVNLGLQASSKCRHLVWFTPQGKVRTIFAVLFHCPWYLIKQLLLCLRDVKVILGFKESDSSLPELLLLVSFPKTKQNECSWAHRALPGALETWATPAGTLGLPQTSTALRGTRRSRNTGAEAVVKGWLA